MSYVDPQVITDYARDGAVVIRGCFTPEQVELVRAGIDRNLADPGPLVAVAGDGSDRARFIVDFCSWQRIPEYGHFIRTSPAATVARRRHHRCGTAPLTPPHTPPPIVPA